jgi:hypothetical protein
MTVDIPIGHRHRDSRDLAEQFQIPSVNPMTDAESHFPSANKILDEDALARENWNHRGMLSTTNCVGPYTVQLFHANHIYFIHCL